MSEAPNLGAKRASYLEGAAFGALSFGAMATLGIVSSITIARLYGVETLGEYALVIAPMNAVWYLSSARERTAFVRELATLEPRAPRVTGLFAAMMAFSVALTVTVAAIGLGITYLLFSGPIDHPGLFLPAVVNMLGYVVLTNTAWNLDAVFAGFRAGRALFWIRLHQVASFLLLAIVAGFVTDSVWGLVVATVGSAFTALLHRVWCARRLMRAIVAASEIRGGFDTLPDLIRFGLKIVPGSISNGVSNEAGTWILGAYGSLAAVGAYNRAWTLGRRFIDLNWPVAEMLFPTLVERRAGGDRGGFDRALVDTIRYSAVAMLLPAAAGGGAAHAVMDLFGPGFSRAADALALMWLMPALVMVASVQRSAMFAVDRPLLASMIGVARMLVTVTITAVLTLSIGITGTALGLLAGAVTDVVWISIVTRRHLERPVAALWPPRELAVLALAYLAAFGAARMVDSALAGLAGLVPALAAGVATYVAVFWVGGGVNDRDRRRLGSLVSLLRARRALKRPVAPEPGSSYAA